MKILICGAGAIGSNLAELLTVDIHGQHEVTVLDFDTVEERNVRVGTQFYTHAQIGMPKVEALQYNIYKAHEREINIINEKLIIQNVELLMDYDLIIDCFDNHDARELTQGARWAHEIVHIGFSDKMTFAIEWATDYVVPSDITTGIDVCEMQGAGSFVKMVAALGSLTVQNYLQNRIQLDFLGNRFTVREVS